MLRDVLVSYILSRTLLSKRAVRVPNASSKLLSSSMLATLRLVDAIWTDINSALPVIPVVVTEEPPADETKHYCDRWDENADC